MDHNLLMNSEAWQGYLLERALISHFKKCQIPFDVSKVIQDLRAGIAVVDAIIAEQEQHLTTKNLKLLERALKSPELLRIFEDQAQTKLIIDSEKFHQLERLFTQIERTPALFEVLVMIYKGELNEENREKHYSQINLEGVQRCKKIMSSQEFISWERSWMKKIQIKSSVGKSQIQTNDQKSSKALDSIRKQLNDLFNFTKVNLDDLKEDILNLRSEEGVLSKLQDEMTVKQFKRLKELIQSQNIANIKAKISEAKNKGNLAVLIAQIKDELLQMFRPFEFNTKQELIASILNGWPFSTILNEIEEVLTVRQYKSLMNLMESEELRQIKQKLEKIQSKPDEKQLFFDKKKKQLKKLVQKIQDFPEFLIEDILNEKSEEEIIIKLQQVLNISKMRVIENFLKTQQMINFKKSLHVGGDGRQDLGKTLTLLLKGIDCDTSKIVDAILKGEPEQLALDRLKPLIKQQQYSKLANILRGPQVLAFKKQIKQNKQRQFIQRKKQELQIMLQSFGFDKSKLIDCIMKNQQLDLPLKELEDVMKARQHRKLQQLLSSEQFLSFKSSLKPQSNQSQFEISIKDQILSLFKGFNKIQDIQQQLIDALMNEKYTEDFMSQFQENLNAKEYNSLQNIMSSQEMSKIRSQIRNHKVEIENQKNLKKLLEPFQISTKQKLIKSILKGQKQEQAHLINQLQSVLKNKQLADLSALLNTQEISELRPQSRKMISSNQKPQETKQINIQERLKIIFKEFDQSSQVITDMFLKGFSQFKILSRIQSSLSRTKLDKLETILNSSQTQLLKEKFKEKIKNDKNHETLSKFFQSVGKDLIELKSFIINNQQKTQKQELLNLYNSMQKKEFEYLEEIIYSPQFIKFRIQQLSRLEMKNIPSLTNNYYLRFSRIFKLINSEFQWFKILNFNVYQLIYRLLNKENLHCILDDQKKILEQKHFVSLKKLLESRQVFVLMQNKDIQSIQIEVQFKYLLKGFEIPQNIIKMILQIREEQLLIKKIETQKLDFAKKKKIRQILKSKQFCQLRKQVLKREKIINILGSNKQYNPIVQILTRQTQSNMQELLKNLKAKIGLQVYESVAIRLYSLNMEQTLGFKLIENEKVRKLIDYFHSRSMQIACLQFIAQFQKQVHYKDFNILLQKYEREFTKSTFEKIKGEIQKQQFKRIIYEIKYENFNQIFKQISSMLSVSRYGEQLVRSIVFDSDFQKQLNYIMMRQSLESLYEFSKILNSPQFKEALLKLNVTLQETTQRFIVQKTARRYIFPKGKKIADIKVQKQFNYSKDEIFINKNNILEDDYELRQHIECVQAQEYYVQFQENETTVYLPQKITVQNCKQIIKQKLNIENQICIQIKKNQSFATLEDKIPLRKCGQKQLYVRYIINLIIKIETKEEEINQKVLNHETISQIQQKIQDFGIKKESQKWLLDGEEILDPKTTTFQKLNIKENYLRIQIIEKRSLEYYGYDKIIKIKRQSFKNFYIEDDQQTVQMIKSSDFPAITWSETFRRISLGYIFSGIKKHSKIQSCLKHIKRCVQKSGKEGNLWVPMTVEQKQYFNQTYVLYNILKSSDIELRTDIFKCIIALYPIPLLMYDQQGKQMTLFEQNYWIMNKAFTITSFGFPNSGVGKGEQINGKSTLLNVLFESNFQDRESLHFSCAGGISTQYNVYQNDEYYVNLIDISNKIPIDLTLKIAKSSNLIIIHTRNLQEQTIKQWVKQNGITQPVLVFNRDVNNFFSDDKISQRKKEKQNNEQKKQFNLHSLPQISEKSLKRYNNQFNQVANSVQKFVRQAYLKEKEDNFWIFSDFTAKQCKAQQFNAILKSLYKTEEDLSKITNYFYAWKFLSYDKDVKNQQANANKMKQIESKAKKEGLSDLLKKIIEFYQNNSSKATQIMSKLRIFLTLIRNELFRDFDQLYNNLKSIQQKQCKSQDIFMKKKKQILDLLDSISHLKSSLMTSNLKQYINNFRLIQSNYKTASSIDTKWKEAFRDITNQFQNHIQPKTFSIQNFWREVIYMSKFDPNYCFQQKNGRINLKDTIVSLSKKQTNDSENFEIINGDLLEMPYQFLKKVFENHQGKKIMIVAIFGPQSSGKSTLLNFILGCDFMSSAGPGRCTKGIYGTYFEISNKQIPNCEAILVLDTQGLKFENRQGFDSKLVLFCLQVCDLIIMNTKGDITDQCQQILANTFDSQAIDSKNLPTVYFVLNCNGGPINTTQLTQVYKACKDTIKLNPAAENVVSTSNARGMPMAFNQIPRRTTAAQITKYMVNKKLPSQKFYTETNELSHQIFKILEDRGRSRGGRTVSRAFDDMAMTWATINRFSILTNNTNRKVKELQQWIQIWLKEKSQLLQENLANSKRQLVTIQLKRIQEWEKAEVNKMKKLIAQFKTKFDQQFPKDGDNVKSYNKCIEKTFDQLDDFFDPITQDIKRSVIERKVILQMQQSQDNGLDDIITLVKSIKSEQLVKKVELSQEQKRDRFQQLWQNRISDLKQGLNRNKMAEQHYKNMEQLYNAALKASDPSKTIYRIEERKGISDSNQVDFKQFSQSLISQIKRKYKQQTIFQSSGEKPVMNIEKQTGDLSFKYLDMSNYFEKPIQQVSICIQPQDLFNAIDKSMIWLSLKSSIDKISAHQSLVEELSHDIQHLTGVQLKRQRIQQWTNYIFTKKWYQVSLFSAPKKIDIKHDANNLIRKFYPQKVYTGSKYYGQPCYKLKAQEKYYLQGENMQAESFNFFSKLKLFSNYPGFIDEIKKIVRSQRCRYLQDGNNKIINQILQNILTIISKQNQKQSGKGNQYDQKKRMAEQKLCRAIEQDLASINITATNLEDIINSSSIYKINFTSNNRPIQFTSEASIKQLFCSFSSLWDKNMLLKTYTKESHFSQYNNSLVIGYINQFRINVKKQYAQQKILQTYIGKAYDEFLNEIQKSNFKKFIEKELKYESCFKQIQDFIVEKKLSETDLNSSITILKNKVHEILQLINKDLQQVSQKLRFDFIIQLHSYAFRLLWNRSFNEEWRKRENLITSFDNKRPYEYQRFLRLSSGQADKENQATSQTFVEEYTKFLNTKILQDKRVKAINLATQYNKKYTREQIQLLVQLHLQKETDDNVIVNYLLKPEDYIQKILQNKVKNNYLLQFEKYGTVDYQLIIKQLIGIVTQIFAEELPDVKDCSIQQIFDINILDDNKNKAFIELFCEMILKQKKDYVSSEQKLAGSFQLNKGRKFKTKKSCTFKQNAQFLKHIRTTQIVITNIKLFCEFLKKGLEAVLEKNELKIGVSSQDKIEAMKQIKIQICKLKCPLCKKACDVDMIADPHHTIHSCISGHQIRAIGGMAVEQYVSGKFAYRASILRCEDLTNDSKFQFNGKSYKWFDFKQEYSNEWIFSVTAKQSGNKKFYQILWNKVGQKICQYYSTNEKKIQMVQYNDQSIKKQTILAIKPAHYIFAIDESWSMGGSRWDKALHSLKQTIQNVSNINRDKNQIITLFKFNSNVTMVRDSIPPQNFDKNLVTFGGGGTYFSPAFQSAINLIKKHLDKNNIFVFISDGEAEYPQNQIKEIKSLISSQKSKGLNIGYTSIIIGDSLNQSAPIMEKITTQLGGKHNLVVDAAQISGLLKQLHFKGG